MLGIGGAITRQILITPVVLRVDTGATPTIIIALSGRIGEMITQEIHLNVNGEMHQLKIDPAAPLLCVLRNDLDLKGP